MTINMQEDINSIVEMKRINEMTNLYDLVPEKCRPVAKKMPAPVNSFHQSLFSFSSTAIRTVEVNDTTAQMKKAKYAFLKIIMRWGNELSNYYWNIHLVPSKLEVFQQSILEVIEQNKLNIIKTKLNELGIKSKTLHNSIFQLKKEMNGVANAPLIKELKREKTVSIYTPHPLSKDDDTDSPSLKNRSSPSNTDNHSMKRSKSESNISSLIKDTTLDEDDRVLSEGEETSFDDERDILYELQAQSFINQCNMNKKNWPRDLVDQFSTVTCPQIINSIGKLASFPQIEVLVDNILGKEDIYWKLGHLMGGLELDNLNTVIYKLDKHQLLRINQVISDKHYTDLDAMSKYFKERVREWISQCNHMKEKIDKLCEHLRFNVTGCNLSRNDLDIITAYTHEVESLECISRKIGWLTKNVVTNLEWMHASTEGIHKDYQKYITRLTEKHEYQGRESGCVWGIIYRLSFARLFCKEIKAGNNMCYNEKNATETFADWVITHPSDYRKVGLLGDISESKFVLLKQDKLRLKEVAKAVLRELGIEKIKHWKQREIFNYTLFKEYLNKPEARKIVNTTISKLLACD